MEVLKPMDPDNWVRWPVNNERMEEYWWFERTDVDYWYKFSENYGWSVMVSVLVIYWVGMSLGRYYMKDRKAYTNLKGLIATYNIAMSIFSIITLFKIGPVLMEGFSSPNWLHNKLCQRYWKYFFKVLFVKLLFHYFMDLQINTNTSNSILDGCSLMVQGSSTDRQLHFAFTQKRSPLLSNVTIFIITHFYEEALNN